MSHGNACLSPLIPKHSSLQGKENGLVPSKAKHSLENILKLERVRLARRSRKLFQKEHFQVEFLNALLGNDGRNLETLELLRNTFCFEEVKFYFDWEY